MGWGKPTYEGLRRRLEEANEIWVQLMNLEIEEIKVKLTRIERIAENGKMIEEFRKADKSQFKARIIEE
jgi:hypothetical protein